MRLIEPEEILDFAFAADDPLTEASIRSLRIEAAQLRYIRPAFGEQMYRRMCAGMYEDLVFSFVKPALSHFIRHELIAELAVRAGDRGVVRPSSEQTQQDRTDTRSDKQDRTDAQQQQSEREQTTDRTVSDIASRKTTEKGKGSQDLDDITQTIGTQKRTVTSTDTDRTTTASTWIEETDATAAVVTTDRNGSDQSTLTKQNSDTTQDDTTDTRVSSRLDASERTTDVAATDTRTEKGTLTDATAGSKNATVKTTLQREDRGKGSSTSTTLRAATTAEWQLLARQALRDARTFLRCGVEYVESNRGEFPDYAPMSGLGATGSRRCVGGIIL